MRWITLSTGAVLLTVGCAGERQPEQQTQPADTMTPVAEAAYDASIFDSIQWKTEQEALERGQVVYNYSCAKCHGSRGLGDAGFVRGGDTLRPPSFREPDWRFAQDKEGLRREVFVGTAEGMPHWGLEGLKPRDIDAVATYILKGFKD